MKITVIGPGGVGAFFSASLKEAGNTVNVVARGESLKEIEENGIRLLKGDRETVSRPDSVSDSFEAVSDSELVILAVKAWHVNEITGKLKMHVRNNTVILPIQNGVETFDTLRNRFGTNVIGGLTRMISYLEQPGVVRNLPGEVSITLGESDGKKSSRLDRIRDTFQEAGIDAYISDDIRKSLWEKFLIMSNMGGIGAVSRAPVGVMLSVTNTRDMLAEAINEVIRVGKAAGVGLDAESRRKTWAFINSLPPDSTNSLQRDIAACKPSELEFMSGSVVKLGRHYGIRTPVHDFIYACLRPWELRARKMVDF